MRLIIGTTSHEIYSDTMCLVDVKYTSSLICHSHNLPRQNEDQYSGISDE